MQKEGVSWNGLKRTLFKRDKLKEARLRFRQTGIGSSVPYIRQEFIVI